MVAVVTGGSRGIGLAIARRFLISPTMTVVLVGRNLASLQAAQQELGESKARCDVFECDLASSTAIEELARSLEAYEEVKILVNNAGVAELAPVNDAAQLESWDRTISINLTAVARLSVLLQPALAKAAGGGVIVNIGSVMGERTTPGLLAYSASKAGLHHLTRALAVELGPDGIRVNAVAPGFVRTDLFESHHPPSRQVALGHAHPLRRVGDVDEVAAVVAFLCSDDASFVHGAVLPVDGGLLCELAIPSLTQGDQKPR